MRVLAVGSTPDSLKVARALAGIGALGPVVLDREVLDLVEATVAGNEVGPAVPRHPAIIVSAIGIGDPDAWSAAWMRAPSSASSGENGRNSTQVSDSTSSSRFRGDDQTTPNASSNSEIVEAVSDS